MNEQHIYAIVRVEPRLYIFNGQAINGYRVVAVLLAYSETIEIDVPNLNNTLVDEAVMDIYRQRVKLDSLGTLKGE